MKLEAQLRQIGQKEEEEETRRAEICQHADLIHKLNRANFSFNGVWRATLMHSGSAWQTVNEEAVPK